VIKEFKEKYPEFSLEKACQILRLPRSSYYFYAKYRKTMKKARGEPKSKETFNILMGKYVSDEILLKEIEELLSEKFVLYGYKKVTAMLRRKGYSINHKKVYRLMKEKGLLLKEFPKKENSKYFPKILNEQEIKAPNERWEIDIKTGKCNNGEKGYVIALKDCYTKEVIGHIVGKRDTAYVI